MKVKHSRRYYLHRKIKEKGFKFCAHTRTVFFNGEVEDKHIKRLQKEFGYNIQTFIE